MTEGNKGQGWEQQHTLGTWMAYNIKKENKKWRFETRIGDKDRDWGIKMEIEVGNRGWGLECK